MQNLSMLGDRILLLVPHPDDEVVGCATALRRARAAGCAVHAVFLTHGVAPVERLWPWQRPTYVSRVAIRWKEAMRCCRLTGLAVAGRQDIPSRTLKANLATTLDLIGQAIDAIAPDAIWTPAYEGGHQDHDVTHFLAGRAADAAGVRAWEFAEYNYAGGRVQANRFPAPRGDEIEIVLDAEECEAKARALAVYRSERRNLAHCAIARECFRAYAAADYDRPPHPGVLFYQRFQWVPRHPRVDHCRPHEVSAAIRGCTAGAGVTASATAA
jgi:LmbE family N-acetylglucosaminyl deacetylase